MPNLASRRQQGSACSRWMDLANWWQSGKDLYNQARPYNMLVSALVTAGGLITYPYIMFLFADYHECNHSLLNTECEPPSLSFNWTDINERTIEKWGREELSFYLGGAKSQALSEALPVSLAVGFEEVMWVPSISLIGSRSPFIALAMFQMMACAYRLSAAAMSRCYRRCNGSRLDDQVESLIAISKQGHSSTQQHNQVHRNRGPNNDFSRVDELKKLNSSVTNWAIMNAIIASYFYLGFVFFDDFNDVLHSIGCSKLNVGQFLIGETSSGLMCSSANFNLVFSAVFGRLWGCFCGSYAISRALGVPVAMAYQRYYPEHVSLLDKLASCGPDLSESPTMRALTKRAQLAYEGCQYAIKQTLYCGLPIALIAAVVTGGIAANDVLDESFCKANWPLTFKVTPWTENVTHDAITALNGASGFLKDIENDFKLTIPCNLSSILIANMANTLQSEAMLYLRSMFVLPAAGLIGGVVYSSSRYNNDDEYADILQRLQTRSQALNKPLRRAGDAFYYVLCVAILGFLVGYAAPWVDDLMQRADCHSLGGLFTNTDPNCTTGLLTSILGVLGTGDWSPAASLGLCAAAITLMMSWYYDRPLCRRQSQHGFEQLDQAQVGDVELVDQNGDLEQQPVANEGHCVLGEQRQRHGFFANPGEHLEVDELVGESQTPNGYLDSDRPCDGAYCPINGS